VQAGKLAHANSHLRACQSAVTMAMTAQMVICWFEEPATHWLRQRQHDCDLVATEVLTARERANRNL